MQLKRDVYADEATRDEPWHLGWADAVVSGEFVFVSGVIASLEEGETARDLEASFGRAFDRIGRLLEKAGTRWDHVVEITAYMTDVDAQLPAFGAVRLRHMRPPYAASTVVQVTRLIPPRAQAEIRVTAHRPAASAGMAVG
jgi:enamine deaminase RidA (YjgF/YER057c/UK114 family)